MPSASDLTLEGLPPEILDIIADFCDDFEGPLPSLRSTCRTLQAATRRAWLSTYFYLRWVDLNPKKLGELMDIAAIPELARSVETITIRCEPLQKLFDRETSSKASKQALLRTLGTMLTEALRNLKNVKVLDFEPMSNMDSDGDYLATDISFTFVFVLSAMCASGLRPQRILTNQSHEFRAEHNRYALFTQCRFMAKFSECLTDLRDFDALLFVKPESHNQLEFADDFGAGISLMRSLTRLHLDCAVSSDRVNIDFFGRLTCNVVLPALTEITIVKFGCKIEDMLCFLLRHSSTLRECCLWKICSFEASPLRVFRELLERLQDSFRLDYLDIDSLRASNGPSLRYPFFEKVVDEEEENEDGFIEIDFSSGTEVYGHDKIQSGLSDMLSCLLMA